MTYYHGGVPGLAPGGRLVPAPPHVTDGCPVCVAREQGLSLTVGSYVEWLESLRPTLPAHKAATLDKALELMQGVPPMQPLDPATGQPDRVYVTTEVQYARWYAARYGFGDVYRVRPAQPVEAVVGEDSGWPTFVAPTATVLAVVERHVVMKRSERRAMLREWKARSRAAGLLGAR